ncbi:MAG: CoA pyrophosphatase [Bacteroidetes bacterium]|nr:CoA pyrophosphatase [Bacteroidota bacterium]
MRIKEFESLKGKLPTTPCLEGREEYFRSVVLLLLVPICERYQILFEKRASGIRQGGEISLPGGQYDDEDVSGEATAIRETVEELGIPKGRIEIVGRLDSIFAPMGAMVDVFVGVSDVSLDELKPNPDEVEKAFALPVSYFKEYEPEEYKVMVEVHPSYIDKKTGENVVLLPSKELGLPDRYWKTWGGFTHKVFVYQTPEGAIWGITARIIREFLKYLYH